VGYLLTLPMVVFWFMHYNVQRLSVARALARFGVAWPTFGTLRLYLSYAFTLVDRHYWLAGRLQPQMEPADRAFLRQVFDDPGPLVVLGSHCGALEMAVPVLESRGRTIRAVARADPGADALLQGVGDAARMVGQGASPIIADGSMEVGLEILRSLRAGEVVTFKSDRVLPGADPASCARVSLAGEEAMLPRGPADVVRLSGARALALSVFRIGPGRFHVEARLLDTEGRSSEELLQDYAACLEDVVRRFPRQWFNFYPYWPSDALALADRPATVPPVMRAARYGLRAALLAAMGGAACAAVLADSALWAFPVAARAVGLAVLASAAAALVGVVLGADVDRSGRRNSAAWLVSLLAPALLLAGLAGGLAGAPLLWRAAPIPLLFAAAVGLLGALRWRLP
jgi:predicted LPLAT superfamily acyltransferase